MLKHKPVMVNEVSNAFCSLKKSSLIVDCTLGLGGHSKELLGIGYKVIGIDQDKNAIDIAKENLNGIIGVTYIKDNFINLRKILDDLKIDFVDGILLDLGVSTYQLENKERGFGFEGPLDMRMDSSQELTAEIVVNEYSEERLSKLLFEYGEKIFARKIARKIVEFRNLSRINRGEELLEIIKKCMPPKYRFSREHHWATPAFRAIRMEVNKDIENLKIFLDRFLDCLKKNGIIAIISFHSIEDRLVKHKFRELEKQHKIQVLTKKPIEASEEEIKENPKEKRAKLRIANKI